MPTKELKNANEVEGTMALLGIDVSAGMLDSLDETKIEGLAPGVVIIDKAYRIHNAGEVSRPATAKEAADDGMFTVDTYYIDHELLKNAVISDLSARTAELERIAGI